MFTKQKIKIEYLKDAKNLQELKKLYFQLSKKYHPDVGGSLEIMQKINNEYDYLKTILKNADNTKEAEKETKKSLEDFKIILDELLKYSNITIEIIGSWLWISGKGTFNIKEEILYNKLHCMYSKSQKKFYWFEGIEKSKKCRGGYLKDAINKFGVIKLQSELKPLLD